MTLSLQDDTVPTVSPDIWSGIEVESSYDAPMTVVSIGIKGPYSYASYQQHMEQLREWLTQHPGYTVIGSPRRFFYDSPFIPDALKRSEVQIPLNGVAS